MASEVACGAKDALDIYRLLRAIEVPTFVAGFGLHTTEPNAAAVSAEAVAIVRTLASAPHSTLPALVSEALGGDRTAAASCALLATELVGALAQAF